LVVQCKSPQLIDVRVVLPAGSRRVATHAGLSSGERIVMGNGTSASCIVFSDANQQDAHFEGAGALLELGGLDPRLLFVGLPMRNDELVVGGDLPLRLSTGFSPVQGGLTATVACWQCRTNASWATCPSGDMARTLLEFTFADGQTVSSQERRLTPTLANVDMGCTLVSATGDSLLQSSFGSQPLLSLGVLAGPVVVTFDGLRDGDRLFFGAEHALLLHSNVLAVGVGYRLTCINADTGATHSVFDFAFPPAAHEVQAAAPFRAGQTAAELHCAWRFVNGSAPFDPAQLAPGAQRPTDFSITVLEGWARSTVPVQPEPDVEVQLQITVSDPVVTSASGVAEMLSSPVLLDDGLILSVSCGPGNGTLLGSGLLVVPVGEVNGTHRYRTPGGNFSCSFAYVSGDARYASIIVDYVAPPPLLPAAPIGSSGLTTGEQAGIAVGAVCGTLLLVAICYAGCRDPPQKVMAYSAPLQGEAVESDVLAAPSSVTVAPARNAAAAAASVDIELASPSAAVRSLASSSSDRLPQHVRFVLPEAEPKQQLDAAEQECSPLVADR